MNAERLKDQTIVVIGGTSGLGLSAVRACLAHGAAVVLVGRDPAKCHAVESQLGPRVRVVVGDASQEETAERAVQVAVDQFGRLDALYHVAGGSGRSRGDGPLESISSEGWSHTLRLNLDSVFYSNRVAVRYWRSAGSRGTVLNMASVLAFDPSPQFFATHAYAAAKAAIIGLTRSAAAFYAPHNIRFNAVAPALVDTPMAQRAAGDDTIRRFIATKQPLDGGRIGHPSDLDEAVVFLLSDDARFITGQVLAVDGGWCLSDGQVPGGS